MLMILVLAIGALIVVVAVISATRPTRLNRRDYDASGYVGGPGAFSTGSRDDSPGSGGDSGGGDSGGGSGCGGGGCGGGG
ncbi:MAG: hypothetical protein JHC84_08335 [Solirubrobacteraceae bacterium]|nr:hypothetical protein [Solirubrobacteraceae bacterium]